MTTASIFGIALAPLFAAIAQVESENGKTSDNVYQLSDSYIDDVNRILGRKEFDYNDKRDIDRSREMIVIYLGRYGAIYESKTGNAVSYSVLARIHNGGPDGWRKKSTLKYWQKVKAVMDAELAAVRSCDAIYLLKGWEESRGAKKELAEAIARGLIIKHEGECHG